MARQQLAFYGSTPAYAPTLECHGWGDLHPELNRLSKDGRWSEMAALIDDDVLDAVAVVGAPESIADALRARLDGIADAVSLTNNRAPDPDHWAGVVADLKRAGELDAASRCGAVGPGHGDLFVGAGVDGPDRRPTRSRNTSSATRASRRARLAPGQTCGPPPNAT